MKPEMSRTIIVKFKKMKLNDVNLLNSCIGNPKKFSLTQSFNLLSDNLKKFGDDVNDWLSSSPDLLNFFFQYPEVKMRRVFTSHTVQEINDIISGRQDESGQDLLYYFMLTLPKSVDPTTILNDLKKISVIEGAYLQGSYTPASPGYTPPPLHGSVNDPKYACQGYLFAAPGGIDAPSAWNMTNGDGTGVKFVDIEQGWILNHEDLPPLRTTDPSRPFIMGNSDCMAHGTSSLGVVVAVKNNNKGIVGIAHNAGPVTLVSELEPPDPEDDSCIPFPNTANAILYATRILHPGDVMLLESQVNLYGQIRLPVEVDGPTFTAIQQATAMGIIVIEAAGNGGHDLDDFTDENGRCVLKKDVNGDVDSGAIMVGASVSKVPHARTGSSNYGSRVDCYAWGENICTTDSSIIRYTDCFDGTSGAAAIVAGVALCVQGMAKARSKTFLPQEMRQILSSIGYGTQSANPIADQIGVMPSLEKIIHHHPVFQPRP